VLQIAKLTGSGIGPFEKLETQVVACGTKWCEHELDSHMAGEAEISRMAVEATMRLCVVPAIHKLLRDAMGHVIEHIAPAVISLPDPDIHEQSIHSVRRRFCVRSF
jgi:hypothetical protein